MEQTVDKGGGCLKGDYHIHTYYSDGVFSPEKIVDLALDAGLQVIALTDHDNVLSYNVAKEYLKTKEVDFKLIPGIEVNTLYKDYEVHILGYEGNLYGKNIEIDILKKLRNEQKFANLEELKLQIKKDADECLKL